MGLAVVVLSPPLIVFMVLTWLHRATGGLETPSRDEPSLWSGMKESFLEGWREGDDSGHSTS